MHVYAVVLAAEAAAAVNKQSKNILIFFFILLLIQNYQKRINLSSAFKLGHLKKKTL